MWGFNSPGWLFLPSTLPRAVPRVSDLGPALCQACLPFTPAFRVSLAKCGKQGRGHNYCLTIELSPSPSRQAVQDLQTSWNRFSFTKEPGILQPVFPQIHTSLFCSKAFMDTLREQPAMLVEDRAKASC